jgi:activator of 2-hydroxyglutaryl-CoA dehydratase
MRNAECEVPNAEPILHPSANLLIGLDVGSTTVKAVVVDPAVDAVLWRAYQRHETRPYETCLDFLLKIERAFPEGARRSWRVFTTGTGAPPSANTSARALCRRSMRYAIP